MSVPGSDIVLLASYCRATYGHRFLNAYIKETRKEKNCCEESMDVELANEQKESCLKFSLVIVYSTQSF